MPAIETSMLVIEIHLVERDGADGRLDGAAGRLDELLVIRIESIEIQKNNM